MSFNKGRYMNKKILTVNLFIISLILPLAYSEAGTHSFPESKIINFSGSYSEPSGSGSADLFIFDDTDFGKFPTFTVEKQANSLSLQTGDDHFELESLPVFIDDLNTLSWDNIEFKSRKNKVELNMSSLAGSSHLYSVNIQKLSSECHSKKGALSDDLFLNLLDACFNGRGLLSLESLDSINFENNKKSSINSLMIDTNSNEMNFSLQLLVKIKGEGETYYEPGKIKIKITKARALFLNVIDKLFLELEKLESEKIIVNKPWIEILVDEKP